MTPVWYAAEVNSPRLWLAWLLLCLLTLAAPAQALNGLNLPMSAFSPGSKRACTAKSFRVDCGINRVDPSGLRDNVDIYVKQDGPGGHVFFKVDDPENPGAKLSFDRNVPCSELGSCDNGFQFALQAGLGATQKAIVNSPVSEDNLKRGQLVYTYKTTPEEDRAIIEYARREQQSPGWFNLCQRNCVYFVKDALSGSGIDNKIPSEIWEPYELRTYYQNPASYPRQTIKTPIWPVRARYDSGDNNWE